LTILVDGPPVVASTLSPPGLLYEIGAIDPATYAVTFGFLAGTALLACAIPARRAARVDPVLSLRSD